MPLMELSQLRSFIAVARSGQLTRACEQLHLTQSAVSKQIKSFEDELGVLLFERQASGMSLTGAGRRLLPIAARALDAAAEIASTAAALRGTVAGPLRLGTIIDPESIKLGPLLGALLQFYPHVDVSLNHGISGGVLALLQAGELDACFYLGAISDPGIATIQLSLEHYLVVGAAEWREPLESADWQALAAMPWLATPPASSQYRLVTQMFAEHGLTHRTVVEADQEASMIELIQSGVAIGLMRERLVSQAVESGQACAWHGARIPCPLSLLYRRSTAESTLMRALLSTVQMVWGVGGE
jgi:DNA-binding transcriptional LysR family regulator